MKKKVLLIIFSAIIINAKAQYVSLNADEVNALKTAINTDKNYAETFAPFLSRSKQALTETPDPIEKIQSEGLLAGNPAKVASLAAVEDAGKIYSLALAYRYSDQKNYLDKATEFLLAWAKTNKASGNPINETKLEDMFTGYDLIRKDIPAQDRAVIDLWLDSIADAEANSSSALQGRGTAINNWNSHRIKIITLINYTLHTNKYDKLIISELEKQLAINLNPDGTTHDFTERDAFHYHTYDLEPLVTTCIVLYRATGKNYFDYQTPNGASIKKSVDFMTPYMTGEKTHGEFVNSTVPFDIARAKNNEKGYAAGTLFNPINGLYLFSLAAYFDPAYVSIIQKAAQSNSYFNWQLAINGVRNKVK